VQTPLNPTLSPSPGGAVALGVRPPQARDRGAVGRLLKHPRLMHYHRLIAVVGLINAVVLWRGLGDWRIDDGSALSALADLTLVNLTAAVVIRQQHVLNAIFALAGRVPPSWPLWLRWCISKVNHIGGIHAGAALAGTAWLCAFTCVAITRSNPTTVVLASCLAALALIVVACAMPAVRNRRHDVFELTHRFGGWTAIALFWALTIHLTPEPVTSWQVWVLALLTACVASPWLKLRRVPVTIERPSSHAVIARLDYGVTPAIASAVGISRSPLREWHSFATVSTPNESGYRLLISRAGDWTSDFIDDPPSHVWVRGVPTAAPMAKVEALYERVLYIVTGSGIGPCLGQILAPQVPARLVWSTRNPRATYGDALVDEVETAQPDALIWDTTERGKPDLVRLAEDACRDFGAEAVFVVSNKPTTWRIVHAMQRRGIPAFGPIWDS
jgi:hypothetical protein